MVILNQQRVEQVASNNSRVDTFPLVYSQTWFYKELFSDQCCYFMSYKHQVFCFKLLKYNKIHAFQVLIAIILLKHIHY